METQPANPDPSFCSFCARPGSKRLRLAAGPGVAICAGCAAQAVSILDQPAPLDEPAAEGRLSEADHPWQAMNDNQLLEHLPEVAAVAGQVDTALQAWVALSRERGVSWARIGTALGITRQSAWERFRKPTLD